MKFGARYYDPSVGRFLQQDPDPGKLNIPSTFLSKYIHAVNNPVMFSDPSGASILGDVFNAVFNAGHDFIAAFGASFDMLVKNKIFQGVLAIALYVVAIIQNPVAGLTSLGFSIAQAGMQGCNTFDNFFRDPLPNAIDG